MKNMAYALTTIDNPYDPFVQFDAWYRFDLNRELTHRDELYVNCCSLLDRYTNSNDAMTDEEATSAVEKAIDEIIKYDVLNIYKKVQRSIDEVEDIEPNENIDSIGNNSRFLQK